MVLPLLPLLGVAAGAEYGLNRLGRHMRENDLRTAMQAFGEQNAMPNPADASMGLGQPFMTPGMSLGDQERHVQMGLLGGPHAQQSAALLGQHMAGPVPPDLDKDIIEFQQAQQLGLIQPDMSYVDFAGIRTPQTTTNINTGDFHTKPLGKEARDWVMSGGDSPSAQMTPAQAVAAGAQPRQTATQQKAGVKFKEEKGKLDVLRNSMDRYAAMINKHGAQFSLLGINDADATEISAAYTNLMIQAKELFNLGVLQGPDMAIIEQALPNPTSIQNQFTSKQAFMNGVNTLVQLLNDKYTALGGTYNRNVDLVQPFKVVGEGSGNGAAGGVWEDID